MKAAVLREKSAQELRAAEQDLRKELFNLRFQGSTGELQNPARIRAARKELARVLTVMAQMPGEKTAAKKDGK